MSDHAATDNHTASPGNADPGDSVESEHQRELQRQAVKRGFYFKPFIPLQITGDFFFQEPSAVEQLAAIADPNSDAARRVRAWEEAKEQERVITESVDYWPP